MTREAPMLDRYACVAAATDGHLGANGKEGCRSSCAFPAAPALFVVAQNAPLLFVPGEARHKLKRDELMFTVKATRRRPASRTFRGLARAGRTINEVIVHKLVCKLGHLHFELGIRIVEVAMSKEGICKKATEHRGPKPHGEAGRLDPLLHR